MIRFSTFLPQTYVRLFDLKSVRNLEYPPFGKHYPLLGKERIGTMRGWSVCVSFICWMTILSRVGAFVSTYRRLASISSESSRSSLLKMGMDDDIAEWCQKAGYGDIVSSKSSGSSGWR